MEWMGEALARRTLMGVAGLLRASDGEAKEENPPP